jgi:hypothetical protein
MITSPAGLVSPTVVLGDSPAGSSEGAKFSHIYFLIWTQK